MPGDLRLPLRLLKLGAVLDLALLALTAVPPARRAPADLLIPARILLVVSAFRCVFPVSYPRFTVLHDTWLSSIFLTRLLATAAEVAYIAALARALQHLAGPGRSDVTAAALVMMAAVVLAQGFVWAAILLGRPLLYFAEELCWAVLFAVHTGASAALLLSEHEFGGASALLTWNAVFGALYLPWQALHLRSLLRAARAAPAGRALRLREGLRRALFTRNPSTRAEDWGGAIGLSWMVGYFATVVPIWMVALVRVFGSRG